jgi:glucose/arabinose dehydrogenase/PKD repeat protein
LQTAVVISVGLALSVLFAESAAAAPNVPDGFIVQSAVPGTVFDTPTGIAYLPDGRLLVAEKKGTVWMVQNGTKLPTPFWSRPDEVLDAADRGLLDVAVDPNFVSNRFVYFLYTVDPDSDGVDTNDDAFGRLTRYQAGIANPNVVDPGSRAILLGRTWAEGPPCGSISHTVGCLRWGTDQSLLVSIGDGAHHSGVDMGGRDPNLFLPGRSDPAEDIGAFRAQFLGSLAGKILRLNPADGRGYPSNPFYDGDPASVRSRVWAYGLRQPFRFCVRPGTGSPNPAAGHPGSLYIGDVGWENWEELSVASHGGRNFGWPCYEGLHDVPSYQSATPAHHGCGTIGTPENPSAHTPPVADWNHWNEELSSPAGYEGNAASASSFYSATSYPHQYQGVYFFADYGEWWIRAVRMDALDNVVQFLPFGTGMEGPVDLITDPSTGDLVYIAITAGQVRRIRYVGTGAGNQPPIASASAAPSVGVVPLTVNFSSTGSSDPDNDPLGYAWDFGDGYGSLESNPIHTYGQAGSHTAMLIVDDGRGGVDSTQIVIVVGETSTFPTTPVLDTFNRPDGPVGDPWVDPVFGIQSVQISNQALVEPCCSAAAPVWNGSMFGPDQEAYVTLTAVTTTAPQHDLMLKLQSSTMSAAHVQVGYDAVASHVQVATYESSAGWVQRGTPIPITFTAGDQLGARAYSNGQVEVYKNGILIGTRSIGGWPFAASGGRIGLTLDGAYSSRLDDFGGGVYFPTTNTPPTAVIGSPQDGSSYVDVQSLDLQGDAVDAQQSAGALAYHWDITLHHNNHQHPGVFVSNQRNDSYLPEDHEDGTGTWMDVKLRVTDGGGLSDSVTHVLFPEVDLEPSAVTVVPDPPQSGEWNTFSFKIHNRGRMLARTTRWRLVLGTGMLAQGDTMVAPLDSVAISRLLNLTTAPGSYDLRVVADTLEVAHETEESNNARTRSLQVVQGPVGVDPSTASLSLSQATPNPSHGKTTFLLQLPRAARVEFSVHDVQGRTLWEAPARAFEPGRWTLAWEGRGARAGLYLARIHVDGVTWVRRFALLR